jgi:2-hydroxy-6-oxonona-2,4-dienedioate hydrolase
MFDKLRVNDDLVESRRAIYSQPEFAETMRRLKSAAIWGMPEELP